MRKPLDSSPIVFRSILITCALFFVTSISRADVVQLKSGEVIEGKIVASDAKTLTIEVQFSPTITDLRQIARVDILGSSVASKDEAAYAKLRALKAPETALDVRPYDEILNGQLRPFLKQFPSSPRAADIRAVVKTFEVDRARLAAGDVKVGGVWYDAAAFVAEKYQIEAAGLLDAMRRQIVAENFPAAMNSFDRLQRSFPGSSAYAEALPLAKKTLPKLLQQLSFAIANLPQTKARRQAAIDRTPIEQRDPIQRAVAAEDAAAAAAMAAAQHASLNYFPILLYDEKGLVAMQQAANRSVVELQKIDEKKFLRGAQLVREIRVELDRNQLDAAKNTLEQLHAAWPEYEGFSRLQGNVQKAHETNASSSKREAGRL